MLDVPSMEGLGRGLPQSMRVAFAIQENCKRPPKHRFRLLHKVNPTVAHVLESFLDVLALEHDRRFPFGPILHHRPRVNHEARLGSWRTHFNPVSIAFFAMDLEANLLRPELDGLPLIFDVHGSSCDLAYHVPSPSYRTRPNVN